MVILVGAGIGWIIGFLLGMMFAVLTRDGIWPDAWAILIAIWTIIGAAIGALVMIT